MKSYGMTAMKKIDLMFVDTNLHGAFHSPVYASLKRHIFFIGVFALFSIFPFLFSMRAVCAEDWLEEKSEHFLVYYTNDPQFAQEVSRKAEMYYKRIASELDYQRYSDFWTWDKRVKVYIYPDRGSFLKSTDQPQWSEGMADYSSKTISSYAWSEGFLDALLPHEMAHLIFRDYVGFTGEVPLWLDEGVAQWMEPKKRELVKTAIARIAQQGKLLSVAQMMSLDIRMNEDAEFVGAYYVQAVSLVSFLVTQYGPTKFGNFCRQLRDGKTVQEALIFVYPTSIRSLEELERKWVQYIKGGTV